MSNYKMPDTDDIIADDIVDGDFSGSQATTSLGNTLNQSKPRVTHPRSESDKVEHQPRKRSKRLDIGSNDMTPAREDEPCGEELKAIPNFKLVESGSDYADVLNGLQIKPEKHDEVVTGIFQPYRVKRMKHLKRATAPNIIELSSLFLRAYGNIIYKKKPDEWLVGDSDLMLQGKQRLAFTPGDYTVDGANAHFYAILEPAWWIMRGIIFERKPSPKKRGPKALDQVKDEDSLQGDIDTEMEETPRKNKNKTSAPRGRTPAPRSSFNENQKKVLAIIDKEIDARKANGTWGEEYEMTLSDTNEALEDLVDRLRDVRARSDPTNFATLWVSKILEDSDEESIDKPEEENTAESTVLSDPAPHNTSTVGRNKTPSGAKSLEQAQPASQSLAYQSNEPFATTGPPSILNKLPMGQAPVVPTSITVYLNTSPPLSPYHHSSYVWPGASIGTADDCKRFFDGLDMRADVFNIRQWVFSYGWNDVMRAFPNEGVAKVEAFVELLEEVRKAAGLGVDKWKLKVLAVGESRGSQRRV